MRKYGSGENTHVEVEENQITVEPTQHTASTEREFSDRDAAELAAENRAVDGGDASD